MTRPIATQTLACQNGAHDWTRPSRCGPKPASCPDHPAPVADFTLGARLAKVAAEGIEPYVDNPAAYFVENADVIALAFAEEIAAEAEAHAEALRAIIARRRARPDLLREDRTHQRIQADEKQAAKEREAAAWIDTAPEVRTAPTRVSNPADDDKPFDADEFRARPQLGGCKATPAPTGRDYAETHVLEGTRKGADRLSVEIRRGALHTGHAKGVSCPATCAECWLIANDPDHLAHRAS